MKSCKGNAVNACPLQKRKCDFITMSVTWAAAAAPQGQCCSKPKFYLQEHPGRDSTEATAGRTSWMKMGSLLWWGSRWLYWNIWTAIFVKRGGWVTHGWNKFIQPLIGKLLSNWLFIGIIQAELERMCLVITSWNLTSANAECQIQSNIWEWMRSHELLKAFLCVLDPRVYNKHCSHNPERITILFKKCG